MPLAPLSDEDLAPLLPVARVGTVERVEPITIGLSGAVVHAVTTSRGGYILRLQRGANAEVFERQLLALRRAAEAGVAPQIVHVDAASRAVVTVRVDGVPLPAALAAPDQRQHALASVVDRLRAVHALDPSGLGVSDPLGYARAAWQRNRTRAGFPPWAEALGDTFDGIAATLADDPRQAFSHNDANPMNVTWDGAKAWLLDWDVAGIGHPLYDLATVAMFLRLDDGAALELCSRHDGAPIDARGRATFRALRRLVAHLCGLTFLGMADDLGAVAAPTLGDAPSLADCYGAMRAGKLDLRGGRGRETFGLALLAEGLAEGPNDAG
jgi:aminoglycoside phosphotransferase (APT) family kinase protein